MWGVELVSDWRKVKGHATHRHRHAPAPHPAVPPAPAAAAAAAVHLPPHAPAVAPPRGAVPVRPDHLLRSWLTDL
jgi:hypothetical protein